MFPLLVSLLSREMIKMARIVGFGAALIIFLTICAGCEKAASPAITPIPIVIPVPTDNAPEGNPVDSSDDSVVRIANVEARALTPSTPGEQDKETAAIISGANDFAFDLSEALMNDAEDENFVYSPISVWLPLAALTNAMDAQDAQSALAVLGAADSNVSDLNNAASRMLYDLLRQENAVSEEESTKLMPAGFHNPVAIANAAFVDKDNTLQQGFAQSFADYYRGAAMSVDFASPEAVGLINQWANDNSNGLIPEIVQDFDAGTAAAIANAVFFSDRWDWEFNPDLTEEDTFHAPGGGIEANFMMSESDLHVYYEDDKVQAMPLAFNHGSGMLIVLPQNEDANGLLASMTSDYFREILNDASQSSGKLLLPRFSMDSGVLDIKPALEEIGLSNLFDEAEAPLTGLVEESPLWLSAAVQKAHIEIDEMGATAAAVTAMHAAGIEEPEPTEPFEMKCDRPFVFVLYDRGGVILFTGIVNRPS